jgi:sugar-specific transcriptional regulator TrmB
VNKEIVKDLETLGFTNYEARVLFTLFEGRNMTSTEIAMQAQIPRASVYDILKSFTQEGICNEIQTSSVVRYELIDPKVVQDKIEKDIHDSYKTKISKLNDSFEKLHPLFNSKEIDATRVDVELIKGFSKQRHLKFLNLLKSSTKEMLLMNKLEGFVYPELDEASIELYKRGGVIKSIYEASLNFKIRIDGKWKNVTQGALIELCENFSRQGEQIRLSRSVPQNIAIFDRKTVFISLVDPMIPKYNRSDIIVKNENFAQFMVRNFDSHWEESSTIEQFKSTINYN